MSERDLSRERRNAMTSRYGPSTLRAMGEHVRIRRDPRAPEGTPTEVIQPRQPHRSGTRLHSSRHLAQLNAVNRRTNTRKNIKRRRIAEQRLPNMGEFNEEAAIHAEPFNIPVNLETFNGSPTEFGETISVPISVPIRSISAMFERAPQGTEQNLYDAWTQHRPGLVSDRDQFRRHMSVIKRMPVSPDEPRRPRSF
jgi:hypothetical protein